MIIKKKRLEEHYQLHELEMMEVDKDRKNLNNSLKKGTLPKEQLNACYQLKINELEQKIERSRLLMDQWSEKYGMENRRYCYLMKESKDSEKLDESKRLMDEWTEKYEMENRKYILLKEELAGLRRKLDE